MEEKEQNFGAYTKEQLVEVTSQLIERCKLLENTIQKQNQALNQAEAYNFFKRLDYLFMIADRKKLFNSEFVDQCIAEITEKMKIVEDEVQG